MDEKEEDKIKYILKKSVTDPMYFNTSVFLHTNTIIGGSCHKYHFCHDKRFFTTNMCLLRQNMSFVATDVLLRQKYACRGKTLVATNTCLMRQKYFVATKKNKKIRVCRDKKKKKKSKIRQLLPMI